MKLQKSTKISAEQLANFGRYELFLGISRQPAAPKEALPVE